MVGELDDVEAMAQAVDGSDAVIWAVGASRNHPDEVARFEAGARNLVAAMTSGGVRRLVALSGAGITIEGERKPLGARVASAVVGRLVKHVVEAKRRECEVFRRSDLDWTLVRPPRVVDGDATGRYVAGETLAGQRVIAGDLAHFMVDQLAGTTYVRAAPFVSS
jgi:putative NADH-flavin reductase